MPANNQALISFEPETPDWEFWRQRSACRLWQAVLLTLNVEPISENRDALVEGLPDRYDEYRRRRDIMILPPKTVLHS